MSGIDPAPGEPTASSAYERLPAFVTDSENVIHVVVETPRHSGSKFRFDELHQLFVLHQMLPPGLIFPCDFGFVPGTLGQDGDPLDAVLLRDQASFAGCVVQARLLGVVLVVEHEDGERALRDDRFLAVPLHAAEQAGLQSIDDVEVPRLDRIERFLVALGAAQGTTVVLHGRRDAAAARELIRAGVQRFRGLRPAS